MGYFSAQLELSVEINWMWSLNNNQHLQLFLIAYGFFKHDCTGHNLTVVLLNRELRLKIFLGFRKLPVLCENSRLTIWSATAKHIRIFTKDNSLVQVVRTKWNYIDDIFCRI